MSEQCLLYPQKRKIAVGKESSLKEVTQAQLGLDNRQFKLCALQPRSSPGGIAAVIVCYSALGGRYPVSRAVQVANGVLPRLGPRAFVPWSFNRPPGGNDRSELLPGRHSRQCGVEIGKRDFMGAPPS
jgi:hypothetical protein